MAYKKTSDTHNSHILLDLLLKAQILDIYKIFCWSYACSSYSLESLTPRFKNPCTSEECTNIVVEKFTKELQSTIINTTTTRPLNLYNTQTHQTKTLMLLRRITMHVNKILLKDDPLFVKIMYLESANTIKNAIKLIMYK